MITRPGRGGAAAATWPNGGWTGFSGVSPAWHTGRLSFCSIAPTSASRLPTGLPQSHSPPSRLSRGMPRSIIGSARWPTTMPWRVCMLLITLTSAVCAWKEHCEPLSDLHLRDYHRPASLTFSTHDPLPLRIPLPWLTHPSVYTVYITSTRPATLTCTLAPSSNATHTHVTVAGSGSGECLLFVNTSSLWQTYDDALRALALGHVPANVSLIIPCKHAAEPVPWIIVHVPPRVMQRTSMAAATSTSEATVNVNVECHAANVSGYAGALREALARVDLLDPATGAAVPYVMDRVDWSRARAGSVFATRIVAVGDARVSQAIQLTVRDTRPPPVPPVPPQPTVVPERVQCMQDAVSLGRHLALHAPPVLAASRDACDGEATVREFSWTVHPAALGSACEHRALVRYQWAVSDASGNRNVAQLQVVVQDTRGPEWRDAAAPGTVCLVVPKLKDGMRCVPAAWRRLVRAGLSDACSAPETLMWNVSASHARLCKSASACVDVAERLDVGTGCSADGAAWFAGNGDYLDVAWRVWPRDACGNAGTARTMRILVAQHVAQCQRLTLDPIVLSADADL